MEYVSRMMSSLTTFDDLLEQRRRNILEKHRKKWELLLSFNMRFVNGQPRKLQLENIPLSLERIFNPFDKYEFCDLMYQLSPTIMYLQGLGLCGPLELADSW